MRSLLEPIAADEATCLHTRSVLGSHFNHPLHYHPEIELTFIVRSRGTRLIGDHVGMFAEGDLCLIGSNLPHQYINTSVPAGGAEAEVLQFDRSFSHGFIDATPELFSFAKLLDRASLGLVFDGDVACITGRLMRGLRLASGLARMRLFMDLIDCLTRAPTPQTLASPGYTAAGKPADSERLQSACQYILDHFAEELDHGLLASKANLAPASFSRLFKRVTGKTCTAFINEIRLGHVCRLLQETSEPVTGIAFECGFRNLSNFNRRFRSRYCCNPREYRRQRR
jgi:AraC-like DNA-binding protein